MSVISQELDYKKANLIHPTYKLSKVLPLAGSQLQVISTTGGQETVFELPAKAFNLSKSFISFTLTPPASGGGNFNWFYKDCAAPIRQLQLYTRGGIYLADINELANYTNVIWKAEIKQEEFLKYDTYYSGLDGGGANRFCVGRGVMLRPSNGLANNTNVPTFAPRPDNSAAELNYTEPQYLEPGDAANTASPTHNVILSFDMLKNTIFSLNKDILPNEVLILRVVWNPSTKIYFFKASGTNPSAGTAAAGNVTLTNITAFIAVEKNQEIVNQIQNQVLSGGLNVLIPYVYTQKMNVGVGTAQTVPIRLNRGHGKRLLKIYYAPFNITESASTAYDHNNDALITGNPPAAPKIQTFYTMLNNERLQEFDLNSLNNDDYMLLKDKLKHSVIQGSGVYGYNWFWLDDFTGSEFTTDNTNLETGIDLSVEQKYELYLTTVNAAYNHYLFAVTQKMLTISPAGITVI